MYVTSGSDDKIKKAMSYGAKGGVNYKSSSVLPFQSNIARASFIIS